MKLITAKTPTKLNGTVSEFKKVRAIKDFRRLKRCPRCNGHAPGTKRCEQQQVTHSTHSFKNWEAYRKSCKAADAGKVDKPIELEIAVMNVVCPLCHYSTYYLKDTGKECDRDGNTTLKFKDALPAVPFTE